MSRKFSVWSSKDKQRYFVSDRDETNPARAAVAEFSVSQLYDQVDQRRRAYEYADYMNKITEAAQAAIDQTKLIEILKK